MNLCDISTTLTIPPPSFFLLPSPSPMPFCGPPAPCAPPAPAPPPAPCTCALHHAPCDMPPLPAPCTNAPRCAHVLPCTTAPCVCTLHLAPYCASLLYNQSSCMPHPLYHSVVHCYPLSTYIPAPTCTCTYTCYASSPHLLVHHEPLIMQTRGTVGQGHHSHRAQPRPSNPGLQARAFHITC